ncbi:hypothetical protein NL465_28700, partial [Klebsiella pneumoniae]|nr:hypothetical protein [Klebsiella pneumoniae]
KACVLPENPASYRVVRTKSYLFNKASKNTRKNAKIINPKYEGDSMSYSIGFKKHMLTGVSYMIPVVVAAGLCMAIAKIFGGAFVANATQTLP